MPLRVMHTECGVSMVSLYSLDPCNGPARAGDLGSVVAAGWVWGGRGWRRRGGPERNALLQRLLSSVISHVHAHQRSELGEART